MERAFVITLVILAAMGPSACRPPEAATPRAPRETPSNGGAPEAHVEYSTVPTPGGIRGGDRGEDLARRIRKHFPDLTLTADGRLAALGADLVTRGLDSGVMPETSEIDARSREVGFMGPSPFVVIAPLKDGVWSNLDDVLAAMPANIRFSHLGVSILEKHGSVIGVAVLGTQRFTLAPVPSWVPANGSVSFRGTTDADYHDAYWVWTKPDGSTPPLPRKLGGDLSFTAGPLASGTHRFEVFGNGPTGLEVLANFPILAGAPSAREKDDESDFDVHELDPAAAIFAMINRSRVRAGLKPVIRTRMLERVADAHSLDMIDAHFFGHQSPTTGNPGNRIAAHRVRLAFFGENVARAPTAAAVHRMLLESPGHRKIIMEPRFTHVGVGVVMDIKARPPVLSVTEVFGAFPDAIDDPRAFETALFDHVNKVRDDHMRAPVVKHALIDAFALKLATRLSENPDLPSTEINRLIQSDDLKGLTGIEFRLLPFFPLTPEDLDEVPYFVEPTLRAVGVGVVQTQPTSDTPRTNCAVFVLVP